ncbi:C4-dicarboxylate transporter/malic acid transport protein-like protein [Aaosphaeria arxii CBS 175.79]|uniref:C4-dicarboxylate transporter/malic acid transport protein-like protein n=1 Tax=Aaosphaeria arxii CBS 175.79 TaxID=1450172 RepID=A0A6A5Y5Q5_9PLEO|nr:C4-dicarboxylate transporter/malic acid transport protein-like protein [Aaosphaeria arxii CBS 175.79]KAF2020848.1 C4-dicarboxylate transporter/malic acid transport protein-like protein [Aaosphaeria arxii CBS 175.79]
MDGHALDRVGTNNPALTAPSQLLSGTHAQDNQDEPLSQFGFEQKQLRPTWRNWRNVVRNFSPSWFSVTMGTGITSLIFIILPFKSDCLYWLSVAFFALNTILFFAALFISILRYVLYPEVWGAMIADSTNSLFLGTIPIGFSTLVESWIFLCAPYMGYWAVTFAWVCWIINCVVALAVTISLTILLISATHQQALHRITAAQLLPISATMVAAATGAEIAKFIQDPQVALGTLLASYVMWGMAMPLSMTVLVMYYTRLALHKLPPREVVVSSFLPLSPLGMGGYTILYLGTVSRDVFPRTQFFQGLPVAGEIFFILGAFIALTMWGFGLIWLCFALASIYKSRPFPFNMGWWGFTFPLGAFAISTIELGTQMPSLFFRILGTIFGMAVVLLWFVVTVGTVRGAVDGSLFMASCVMHASKKTKDEEEAGEEEEEVIEEGEVGKC